jgi:hypothetical protein
MGRAGCSPDRLASDTSLGRSIVLAIHPKIEITAH